MRRQAADVQRAEHVKHVALVVVERQFTGRRPVVHGHAESLLSALTQNQQMPTTVVEAPAALPRGVAAAVVDADSQPTVVQFHQQEVGRRAPTVRQQRLADLTPTINHSSQFNRLYTTYFTIVYGSLTQNK